MPLRNYLNYPPSVVILADNRDPYLSWQNHIKRTGRGGVDLVAPVGTPVYAPTDGIMVPIPNNGGAGNSCNFFHDASPGWKDVFSHLSRYVSDVSKHFDQGQIVGFTGISGNVAPHLHRHLLDPSGIRRNPWDYFSGTATAGGGVTPLPETERKRKMLYEVVWDTLGYAYVITPDGCWRQVTDTTGTVVAWFQRLAQMDQSDQTKQVNGVWVTQRKPEIFLRAERDKMFEWLRVTPPMFDPRLVPSATPPATVDVAAIAEAVNDDAAARRKEWT